MSWFNEGEDLPCEKIFRRMLNMILSKRRDEEIRVIIILPPISSHSANEKSDQNENWERHTS